jgi:hypothetical protein
MRWGQFEADVPSMAATARSLIEQTGVAVIGTVRADGSPRINSCEPGFIDGELYLGMMWGSRKALDLLRDPRIVVRNTVCTSTGDEAEVTLRGRAIEIPEPTLRRRFVEAMSERATWREPFHLFALDIEAAALVQYGSGMQTTHLWPQGTEVSRPYA